MKRGHLEWLIGIAVFFVKYITATLHLSAPAPSSFLSPFLVFILSQSPSFSFYFSHFCLGILFLHLSDFWNG